MTTGKKVIMGNRPYPWEKSYPQSVRWDAELKLTPLPELLQEAAERWPHRPSLYFLGRTTSFRRLHAQVKAFAAGLQKQGVKKGSRVGLFMPNCPQFVIAYYGVLVAGGTVVNINPLYTAADIAHEIKDAEIEIAVTLSLTLLYPKLASALGTTPLKKIIVSHMHEALPFFKAIGFRLTKSKEVATIPRDERHVRFSSLLRTLSRFNPVQIDPLQDVAVLQYTGGTTGTPKAAMLTHANLVADTRMCGYWFQGLKEGSETVIGAIPFFHSFSMTAVMNLGIHKGTRIIIHPKFDIKTVLEDIQKHKPSLMCGVPTMFTALVNMKSIDKYNLKSLRICVSGGAPLPAEIQQKFESLTGCSLVEGYGLSETSPVVACQPLFGEHRENSIGLPFPRTILEIVDLDDKITVKTQGEEGEICVRGPQVMKGYWNKPQETADMLRQLSSGERRLHTGDIGKMDAEGFFYVVDRLKEMIISGGYNIYPRNIEEVIYTHPDVAEAAVIAMEHPQRGQVPKAIVVKKPGSELTETQLKQFLKDKLAGFALPAKIEFRESLPKTLIGKIDKKALKG